LVNFHQPLARNPEALFLTNTISDQRENDKDFDAASKDTFRHDLFHTLFNWSILVQYL
jgi:hypothetical protein